MPSFVFYLFLNSTFAFSSLKKFQPHHFPWALCRQSTLNNQHILTGIMALCSPRPHRWKPTSLWVRHIHTVFKPTPTSNDLCPLLPPEAPYHKSLTLTRPGWQIGFWRRTTVKSRIDGGWKKRRQHTSLSFIIPGKVKEPQINFTSPWSQITTRAPPPPERRNGTRNAQSPTVIYMDIL